MRLSQKLILFVLVAAVAPLSFAGAWLLREAEHELGARLEAEQRALVTAAAEATATQIGATLDGLARTSAMIDWVSASDAEVEGGLRLLLGQASTITAATLFERERVRPMASAADGPSRAVLLDAMPLGALAGWGDRGLVALGPVQQVATPWLPVAIQVGPRAAAAAMLVLALDLRELSAWLALHTASGATIELVDGDGRIVASSGESRGPLDAARLAALRSGHAFLLTPSDEQVASSVVPGKLGLSAVVSIPRTVARAPIASLRRTIVGGAVATSSLLILVALLFIRRVTQRLEAVASTAQAFSRGELGQRVVVEGEDELGELAKTFNAMGAELEVGRAKLLTWNDELSARVDAATAELRAAQAQLLEAQKLAALGQLGAGVAHEINNPLVGILGNAQLLLMDRKSEDPDFALLRQIEDSARRCRDITAQLLRFSQRSGEVRLVPLDLNGVIERALKPERPRLTEANIVLDVQRASSPVMVDGDSEALEHVLFQLFNNARVAMRGATTKHLLVRVIADASSLGIEVRDTGKGMNELTKSRMFEPFFTTKEVWSNLGLGLSVSYRIVEQHGGRFEVETSPGVGTGIVVRLRPQGTTLARPAVAVGAVME